MDKLKTGEYVKCTCHNFIHRVISVVRDARTQRVSLVELHCEETGNTRVVDREELVKFFKVNK